MDKRKMLSQPFWKSFESLSPQASWSVGVTEVLKRHEVSVLLNIKNNISYVRFMTG